METMTRTIDEGLNQFTLVHGLGDGETTACVMTLVSWLAGEGWSDKPDCVHPLIGRVIIRSNDHPDATYQSRADLARDAATMMGTAELPDAVVAHAMAQCAGTQQQVGYARDVIAAIHADSTSEDLTDANLLNLDLTGAHLAGAKLAGASLVGAYLVGANLTDANLTDANLTDAVLTDANLADADLTDANLTDAVLTGANLAGSDLTGANLRGAKGWRP